MANSLSINIFQGLKFTDILIANNVRGVDPPLVLVLHVRVRVLAAGEAAAEVGEAPGGGGQTGDRDLAAEQPAHQPPHPGHHPRLGEGLVRISSELDNIKIIHDVSCILLCHPKVT